MSVSKIFTPRSTFRPFEYPEVIKYQDAINHAYWLVSEWSFTSDVQDFFVKLDDSQRNAVKNTLLAISQIEVNVKMFWAKLGDRFPKPEFFQVGITCGESEVRHESAYSHLLQVLNLNNEFENLLEVEAVKGRVNYLSKYLKEANSKNNQEYLTTLTLFSLFIENVSLFSQFVIIKSFYKHLNVLKDLDNVVSATMKEEQLHCLLGVYIINTIKEENPEWFDESFYKKIYTASRKAFKAESEIIDWIFEKGELDFLPKDVLKEFLKDRFNQSVGMIGGEDVYKVDQEKLRELTWFDEELYGEVKMDFFHQRPVNYTKKLQSVQAEDLF